MIFKMRYRASVDCLPRLELDQKNNNSKTKVFNSFIKMTFQSENLALR